MIDAKEYGRALFLLTEEKGTTDKVMEDMKTVRDLFREEEKYVRLLDTPALAGKEKTDLIGQAFASLDGDLVNFLKILSEKHSVYAYPRCLSAFSALYDESRGIERVTAITAVPLSRTQEARLSEKLAKETGKIIVLTNTVDPSLLGGIRLRYLGKQIDASLATRLSSLEKAMRETIV